MTETAAPAEVSATETTEPASSPRAALDRAFNASGLDDSGSEKPKEPKADDDDRELSGRDRADLAMFADAETRREIVGKHLDGYFAERVQEAEWESSAPHRETLREYFPAGIAEPLKYILQVNADLEKNKGNSEMVAAITEGVSQWYLKNPPFLPKPRGARTDDTSIGSAYDKAERDVRDREEIGDLLKDIAATGIPIDQVLQREIELHESFVADPVGMGARLAGMFMPTNERDIALQQQTEAERQQSEAQQAEIVGGLQTVIDNGWMPGLETPELQDEVVSVLESKSFQRTGNGPRDLQRAWEVARDRLAVKEQREQQKQQAAELKSKAKKSFSGAPNNGSGVSGHGPHKSTRDALTAAMGGI